MRKYKSESTDIQVAVDTTNEKVVFVNSDFVEIPAHGDIPKMYEFDVTEYTMEEYKEKLMKDNADHVTMERQMTDLDLANIEAEQTITDLDLRVTELEE